MKIALLKPKNIFLLDAFGATLTMLLLFSVLIPFNNFFGLSKTILEYLSFIALLFSIHSSLCYLFVKNNWKSFLKVICTANILYCILTLGIVMYHYKSISIFGLIYFSGEIIVITGLVLLEMKTIKKLILA